MIPRSKHEISRKNISPNALKVLYRLKDGGYDAYLVGGCIRDLLLGLKPKDFDVVTNATPDEIKSLFRNCRLIGRRFRLAHIVFGREIIEVATLRGHHQESAQQQTEHGQLLRDNVYGTIEEDAERRDFSINALYYSIADYAILDFAHGVQAINERNIQLIGDPETRYREDPVRMLRAVRFATKLDMNISPDTGNPIYELAPMIANIPAARLFEEALKLFMHGEALKNYELLRDFGLFQHMFPVISEVFGDPESKEERLLRQVFINTDKRIRSGKKVTPAYIFAALLWYPLESKANQLMFEGGLAMHDAYNLSMAEILTEHCKTVSLPKRFSMTTRDIWQLQLRLPKRAGKRAERLAEHPKFRAGYDFLLLRSDIEGGDLVEIAQWWTRYQEVEPYMQRKMANSLFNQKKKGRPHNRRRQPRKGKTPKQQQSNHE